MLAHEWKSRDNGVFKTNCFHFIYRNHIVETNIIKHQFQIRIFQFTTVCSWHDQVLHFMSERQQGFKQNMILVVMGNQYIIDRIRQITIREMFNARLISVIAYNRVNENADVLCFNKDTGMSEISHSNFITSIFLICWRWRLRKERLK